MVEFKFTDVGEGMHEGEILRILVKAGESVQQDQPIFEVQTDKVTAELTAPVSGVVREIFFGEGATIEVGNTLLLIDTGACAQSENNSPGQPAEGSSHHQKEEPKQQVQPPKTAITNGPRRALGTPYVRQLARELKIDIEQIKGTGAAGRVTEEDVRRAIVPQEPDPPKESATNLRQERLPLRGMRKKIAEHMVKSVSVIPHVTSVDELELDRLVALRASMKPHADKRNVKLTYLPFFIKALIIALKQFPTLNASIDDETSEIILKHYYNIGIAIDTEEGLIVPVIKDADRKSIFQLAEQITELAALARDGKLKREHIADGTFTISNVGPIGGLQATPIINHPEVAILALHKLEKRWVVRDDQGVIRQMMNTSLSFDHRLIDGLTAVKFTNRLKELLEEPNLLFAEMV